MEKGARSVGLTVGANAETRVRWGKSEARVKKREPNLKVGLRCRKQKGGYYRTACEATLNCGEAGKEEGQPSAKKKDWQKDRWGSACYGIQLKGQRNRNKY